MNIEKIKSLYRFNIALFEERAKIKYDEKVFVEDVEDDLAKYYLGSIRACEELLGMR